MARMTTSDNLSVVVSTCWLAVCFRILESGLKTDFRSRMKAEKELCSQNIRCDRNQGDYFEYNIDIDQFQVKNTCSRILSPVPVILAETSP